MSKLFRRLLVALALLVPVGAVANAVPAHATSYVAYCAAGFNAYGSLSGSFRGTVTGDNNTRKQAAHTACGVAIQRAWGSIGVSGARIRITSVNCPFTPPSAQVVSCTGTHRLNEGTTDFVTTMTFSVSV